MAEYRRAIAIDPTFVAAYANLADLYRARGVDAEAEKVLREGIARNPRAAVLHHTLGLVLVRQKRKAESLVELRSAVQLAPDDARFAYVYAVAQNDAGQHAEALKTLDAALKRHPYDRDVLSGLAYFNAQAGRREQALAFVHQLRNLDPENPEYAQMGRQMAGESAR
jgi:Flp pilus assembly protein TadD